MDFQSFFVNASRASYRWEAEVQLGDDTDTDWGYSVLPVTEDDYERHVLRGGWSLLHFSREIVIDEVEYTAAAYAQALESILHTSFLDAEDGEGLYRAGDYWMPTEINESSRQGLLTVLRGVIKGDLERIAHDTISPDVFGHAFVIERGYQAVKASDGELVIA